MVKRVLSPDDPRHGTYNGYRNLGCRCRLCCDAHTVYIREARWRKGWNMPMAQAAVRRHERACERNPHGTLRRYNIGCRCEECRAAEAQRGRDRRAAHRRASVSDAL